MPTETNFAPNLGEIFEATDGPVEVFDFNGVPSGAAPEGAFGIDTSNGDFYQVINGSWIFKFSTGGGVGAVQTPWAQDIQGAGFDLLNVRDITATRNITAEGRLGAFDTTRVGDTDNEWYWKAEDAGMSLYGTGSGGTFKYMSISDPNEGMVLHGSYSFHASGFDGKQLSLLPDANVTPLTISGYSLTVANAQSMIDLAGTWNTSGAPTAIKLNLLDTASDAASLLMDLQVGSASRFKVGKLGSVTMTGLLTVTQATANTGILASTGYSLNGSNATSMLDLAGTWNTSGNPVALKLAISNTASGATAKFISFLAGAGGATEMLSVTKDGSLVSVGNISATQTIWSLTNLWVRNDVGLLLFGASNDVVVTRDAANTLALRNSTNAQTFNVYNTFTDASNYEKGFIRWSGNVLEVGSQPLGTGTNRTTRLKSNVILFNSGSGAGTDRWRLDNNGHFIAEADNTYDIGASGATRPRNLYVGTSITSPAGVLDANGVQAVAAGFLYWLGRSVMASPSDGVIRLTNNATTDFSRLQFGGTTSSFPALKRSSTALICRLADDSADAPFTCAAFNTTSIVATGTASFGIFTKTTPVAVASLPAASTAGDGARAYVTDAVSQVFGATVTGGGAVPSPVYSDGTVWRTG